MIGPDRINKPFGRYLLVERLAKGGMGEVFLAVSPGPHGVVKPCVIKMLLPEFASDAESVQRFIEEARVLVSLSHRNIVQILEFGKGRGEYFIAMEFVEGVSLGELLTRGGKLPFDIALFITKEILSGLAYAHSRSDAAGRPLEIVHRDISPSNVLISHQGDVKIADFGLARRRRERMTQHGIVLGKLAYMAPEILKRAPASPRSDLYAAGVCLYEMISGRPLFDLSSMGQQDAIVMLRTPGAITPPSRFQPDTPRNVDQLALRALVSDPQHRFASAEVMRREVQAVLAEVAPSTDGDTLASLVQHRIGHRKERRFENPWSSEGSGPSLSPTPGPSLEASSDQIPVEPTVTYVLAEDFFALLKKKGGDSSPFPKSTGSSPFSSAESTNQLNNSAKPEDSSDSMDPADSISDPADAPGDATVLSHDPAASDRRAVDEAETSIYDGGHKGFPSPFSSPISVSAFVRPVSESNPVGSNNEPPPPAPMQAPEPRRSRAIAPLHLEPLGPAPPLPPAARRIPTPLAPLPSITLPPRRAESIYGIEKAKATSARTTKLLILCGAAAAVLGIAIFVMPALLRPRQPERPPGNPTPAIAQVTFDGGQPVAEAPSDGLAAARLAAERALLARSLAVADDPGFGRLDAEASRAAVEKRVATAVELYKQLEANVDGLLIDAAFIERKQARLSVIIEQRRPPLNTDEHHQVDRLITEARQASGRGSHDVANRKLEQARRLVSPSAGLH